MNNSTTWEDVNFRDTVYGFIVNDERFAGMASYLSNVRLCWSYTTANASSGHGFIFFNPDWWDKLPEETRKTVIFHHGLSMISRHLQRGKGLHPSVFAMASQNVINLFCKDEGFTAEGWNWLCDTKYLAMSVEGVYNQMMEGEIYVPPEFLETVLPTQVVEDMIEEILEDEDEDLGDVIDFDEENVIRTISENPGYGIGSGTGSAGFDLNIGMGQEVLVDHTFEEILKPYMEVGEDTKVRSFRRPSRRTQGGDFILPGRVTKKGTKPERIKHLYLLLDVSGSIGEKQGRQFNYGAQTIKKVLDPEMMTVIFYDTQIKLEKTFTSAQKYTPLKVRAGGGTSLTSVYKRIAEINPEVVINFTDLQVAIPPQPEWDTIWIVPDTGCCIPENLYGPVYLMPKRERP